ncbi:MAG TPA: hypothetical protein DCX06_09235 [Opitutae bacterium]|nr:hypothetical protein [Opitutae bacterium]
MMTEETQTVLFLGRFHTVALHLPIAFILLLALMELLPSFRKGQKLYDATQLVALLAAGSATLAAFLGWLLSSSGEYSEDLLQRHQWLGVLLALLTIACWIQKCLQRFDSKPKITRIYRYTLTSCVVVMILTSHDGGSLTHGKGYLTYYLKQSPKVKDAHSQPLSSTKLVPQRTAFEHHIKPILETHCYNCHGPEKSKGKLRLDSPEALIKGGEYEPGVDYDDLLNSALLTRLLLPEDDDDVMPPEGKKRLHTTEIEAIRWWLEAGASFELPASAYHGNIQHAAAIPQTETTVQTATNENLLSEAALTQALQALEAEGFVAKRVSKETLDVRIEVSLARETLNAAHIQQIGRLKDHVVDLDLSRTPLNERLLAPLGALTQLKRLNLSSCSIDETITPLLYQFKELEYLNLYNNPAISDTALGFIATLPKLKTLYLWQTTVTPQADAIISKINPDLNLERAPNFLKTPTTESRKESN